jgi:O-antigen/teichoic acid export membrane protein
MEASKGKLVRVRNHRGRRRGTGSEMNRRQILLNALTTLAQVIGSAATLFLLYGFLLRTIGIEQLGIWSLVLATTSVVTLANQGFSTSIVKFVAKYAAREDDEEVSALLQTALISIGLALAVISIGLYPSARWILGIVLSRSSVVTAYAILPFAFASLWTNILGGILQAGLAGHQLITLCNYVELGGSVLYLLLAILLVPGNGLLGLAYAQIAQAVVCFLATWFLLHRRIPRFPFIPRRWNRPLFLEIASYGFQFQFITASQALREPVTKALLAKFGGLALTGYYDMASRWVVNFREMIVQANQVLVPTVSHLHEREPESIPALYRESYRLIFFLAIPTFASLVVMSPLVSRIWIGYYEPVFVRFVGLLAVGWLINTLANPAYVMDLGTGSLRWITIGCTLTATLNLGVGFAAGKYWGGTAVVVVSVCSLILGYLIVVIAYQIENRVPFSVLLPRESRTIVFSSLVGLILFLPIFRSSFASVLFSLHVAAAITTLAVLIAIPMWGHPLRKRLQLWVLARLPA